MSNLMSGEYRWVCSTCPPNQSRWPNMEQARAGRVIWLTGLSGAGKTTLGRALLEHFLSLGYCAEHLDGDEVRRSRHAELGYSAPDRNENVRRIGLLAQALASRQQAIVIVSAVSPFERARAEVRELIPDLIEVYVNAPVEICERRDRKDLYRRARLGLLSNIPGIDLDYERPRDPHIECRTDRETAEESLQKILAHVLPKLQGHSQRWTEPSPAAGQAGI